MPQRIHVGTQLKLDGTAKQISRLVWAPGEFATLRAKTRVERCENCDKIIAGRKITEFHTFSPWAELDQKEGDSVAYLCESCSSSGIWEDGTFFCERCCRDVSENNGYRTHIVSDPESPDEWCCVGCAQRYMLEHGHSDKQLASGEVHCDFYSHYELEAGGWERGEEFNGSYLARHGAHDWQDYCLSMKSQGYLVLTDQGATGLGNGYPDSITVWIKRQD